MRRLLVPSFALIALFVIGGEVIQTFVLPLIWGILVGTYSSIFVSAPLLISFNLRPSTAAGAAGSDDTAAAKT